MTTIWRLESVKGQGIYTTNLCNMIQIEFDDCNFYNKQRQPMPTDDLKMKKAWGAVGMKEDWLFGFSSLRTYKAWFNKLHARRWFADHKEIKVVLSRYEVPSQSVIKGDSQAVFLKRAAVLIERYRPDVV